MKKRNAFTIIEVVLVLAIAGLIFLMVFIALPALQRSQRNTRRRQDVSRIASAVTAYYSNTGSMPFKYDSKTGSVTFNYSLISKYIDSEVAIPADPEKTKAFREKAVFNDISCPEGKSCEHFKDPNGSLYQISLVLNETAPNPQPNTMYFRPETKCGSVNGTVERLDGQKTKFTVMTALEGGSFYCADND